MLWRIVWYAGSGKLSCEGCDYQHVSCVFLTPDEFVLKSSFSKCRNAVCIVVNVVQMFHLIVCATPGRYDTKLATLIVRLGWMEHNIPTVGRLM